jgi:hypothetical protein
VQFIFFPSWWFLEYRRFIGDTYTFWYLWWPQVTLLFRKVERVAKANGFSLHAGVSCEGHQKDKRERLCRYIARPAVAVPRLSLSSTGKVLYTLKTPYRDGTTQVGFDPVHFIARLAALAPKPRISFTQNHFVLASSCLRRGKAGRQPKAVAYA